MNTDEFLQDTKNLIDTPDKWCKLQSHNVTTKWLFFKHHAYCLSGALGVVSFNNHDSESVLAYRNAYNFVEQSIRELYPDKHITNIVSFNDATSTQHSQVMDVLDRAIEKSQVNKWN